MNAARRSRARRQQRGAAVFIVVMVITLLTAVGIFAARSTSLTDAAAGFEREAAQTSYLSLLAGNTLAAELGNGMATTYVHWLRGTSPEICQANAGIAGAPCYRLFMSDLDKRTTSAGGEALLDPAGLNSASALKANFLVEMTDPGPAGAPMAGTDLGANSGMKYVSLTLTTTAMIMPALAACGPQASIGSQKSRAVVVVGPVSE